jgi:prepilin-type processing-associated H-X9-DG protein
MKNSGINWAEPRELDLEHLPSGITKQNLLESLSDHTTQNFLKSLTNHAGCFNAVFADGHVEAIPVDITWDQFMAMLTIAGGEKVDRSSW